MITSVRVYQNVSFAELPACVLEEEFADDDESAREEAQKQGTEKDGKRPAILTKAVSLAAASVWREFTQTGNGSANVNPFV